MARGAVRRKKIFLRSGSTVVLAHFFDRGETAQAPVFLIINEVQEVRRSGGKVPSTRSPGFVKKATEPQLLSFLIAQWIGPLDKATGRTIDEVMMARWTLGVKAPVDGDGHFLWTLPAERH